MTTTHILHGGSAQHINSENDLFFKEILKRTKLNNIKVLLVHFASDLEKLEANIEKDSGQFNRNKGNRKLNFTEAKKEKFLEQINERFGDTIYIHVSSL